MNRRNVKEYIKNMLEEMDKTCGGCICLPDFCAALAKTRLTQNDIDGMFMQQAELDVCASIDYINLINNILESKSRRESERMASALSTVDGDKTGKISKSQVYNTLHHVIPNEKLDTVLESIDEDEVSIQRVLDVADKEQLASHSHQGFKSKQ